MRNLFREYFTFSKRERNGVLILLSIIFIILLYLYVAPHFLPSPSALDKTKLDSIKAMVEEHQLLSAKDSNSLVAHQEEEDFQIHYFYFNPNKATKQELLSLGIPEKTTTTILGYVEKGGKFKMKEDLKKIYGLPAELYQSLEPYIVIEDAVATVKNDILPEKKNAVVTPQVIELNSADSITLLNVKGIGPVFASRIIKFRNKLGGFCRLDQLKEVYGLDSSKYTQVLPQIKLDATLIKKIAVNSVEVNELKQHPYFRSGTAYHIINYRKQHGSFKNADDLKQIKLINDSIYNKIVPYLDFN